MNYLKLCPAMKQVADSLKDSPYMEDRSCAEYLQSKLDEMEDDTYQNTWNLADPDKPLKDMERIIMNMRYFKALPARQIARRLGLDEQYVRNVCSKSAQKYKIPQHEYWTAGGKLE